MSYQHGFQSSRFELKYIIDEARATAVREFLRAHLEPDEHWNRSEPDGYAVHSLYLDSPGLALCRATEAGERNRFKLRIRFYDSVLDNPVFFEIKRRVNDAIVKERAMVHRTSVPRLLNGLAPQRSDLMSFHPKSYEALLQFCRLRDRLRATRGTLVSYRREAYVPHDHDDYRVTFDRYVLARPYRGTFCIEDWEPGRCAPVNGVILELKFNARFPQWMREMAQALGLRRISMPKYVNCVHVLGPWQNVWGRVSGEVA